MGRRIYVIPGRTPTAEDVAAAAAAGTGEIVSGIPPRLLGALREEDLPCVHEEPDSPPDPDEERRTRFRALREKADSLSASERNEAVGLLLRFLGDRV